MQKGTALEGALLTEEVLESSADILKSGQFGGVKGAQQFFTPDVLAKLVADVVGRDGRISVATLDPTAGDGSLLKYVDPARAFGVEIDKDQIAAAEGGYNPIQADVKSVYSLLRRVCPSFPVILANPPFGLEDWSHEMIEEGKRLGSTLLTWHLLHEMLQDDGQYVFITGKNRFYREIAEREDAAGIYYVVECDDLFEGTLEPCVVAFGVHAELRKEAIYTPGEGYADTSGYTTKQLPREMLDIIAPTIREARGQAVGGNRVCDYTYGGGGRWLEAFDAITEEHKRRVRLEKGQAVAHKYDIWAEGDKLKVKPSPFASLALAQVHLLNRLVALHNKKLNWFASYENDWLTVQEALDKGAVAIDPKVEERVAAILADRHKNELPLYGVKLTQRIGFLKRQNEITCIRSDEERGFTAGETYDIKIEDKAIETPATEMKIIQRGENAGELKEVQYLFTERYLDIQIQNDRGRYHHFYDSASHQEDIRYIVEHFDLPDPGDVASLYPQEVELHQEMLWKLQRDIKERADKWDAAHPKAKKKPFHKLRHFQVQDLSRLLVKMSGILAWHQGLGKTIGAYAWFEIQKRLGRIQDRWLIICPQDLIPQWQAELERFAGRKPEIIKTHGDAVRARNSFRKGGAGWYITYYEALATNGVRGKTKLKPEVTVEIKTENIRVTGTGRRGNCTFGYYDEAGGFWQAISIEQYREMDYQARNAKGIQRIPAKSDKIVIRPPTDGNVAVSTWGYINPIYQEKQKVLTSKHLCPACKAERGKGWNGMACSAEDRDGNICKYVHWEHRVKPMGSLLSVAFKNGAIVVDEGTMISGDYAKRSEVIRGLNARCKLLMTGTPIKEYIPHAFWPLWWALGNNSPRFPFGYNDKRDFEDKHAVIRYTIVANKRTARKVMPKVTGLSTLWAMLPASIVRRRKEETGEPLVRHTLHPVTVPLGIGQVEQMQQWIARFPDWFIETHPDSDVVTKGGRAVVEQMTPMLGLAQKLEWAEISPLGDGDHEWTGVEGLSNWTPANLRTVLIAMSLVKKGRKVVVGSSLIKQAEFLASALKEKGVNAVSFVDESGQTINPKKRAKMVQEFQTGDADVLVTTQKSLRFGHNVDAATAMVVCGLPWEFEVWDQFIARHHRFTSDKPVDTYIVIPGSKSAIDNHDQPTVTRRKWNLLEQKGDAAALALDGRLIEADVEDISEEEVARELMEKGFNIVGNEVPEAEVEEFWAGVPDIGEFVVDERWLQGDLEEEGETGPTDWDVFTSVIGDFTKPPLALPVTASEWIHKTFEPEEPYWVATAEEVGYEPEPDWEHPTTEMVDAEAEPEHGYHDGDQIEDPYEVIDVPPRPTTDEEIAELPVLPPEVLEPTAEPTTSSPTELVAAIKEMAELHSLGVLTDEEFTEGKAGLLAQLKVAA